AFQPFPFLTGKMKLQTFLFRILIVAFLSSLQPLTSFADSATWSANPTSSDWNSAANWTPATIPDHASDTATFATSSITNVSTSSRIVLSKIVFSAGASPYTITASGTEDFEFVGAGVMNSSGIKQNFVISHLTA